jgi:hypothetical protein
MLFIRMASNDKNSMEKFTKFINEWKTFRRIESNFDLN